MIHPTAFVIDHSAAMRDSLGAMLKDLGLVVCGHSPNGASALESLRLLKPDLILLDILIPGGTGIETISNIRQSVPAAKVIVLTSLSDRDMVLECRRLGAADYVLKPFEWLALKKRVTRVVRSMSGERLALAGVAPAGLARVSSGSSFFEDILLDARRDKAAFIISQPNMKQGDIQEMFDELSG